MAELADAIDSKSIVLRTSPFESGQGHQFYDLNYAALRKKNSIKLDSSLVLGHLSKWAHIDIDAEEYVFGAADDENTIIIPLNEFPAGVEPVVGSLVEFELPHDQVSAGRVIRIEDQEVLMDFNHPLIGKNVRYEIKIVAIHASSEDE